MLYFVTFALIETPALFYENFDWYKCNNQKADVVFFSDYKVGYTDFYKNSY